MTVLHDSVPPTGGGRQARPAARTPLAWAALAWMFATQALGGTTLHVSPTGSDSNPGTAAAPLATVRVALEKIGPPGGGEVVLLDGLWNERTRIGIAFRGPVVIRAADPGKAVLRNCLVHAAANVVVDGVRFDGQGGDEVANVCQVSQSAFVTLRNCEFTHGPGGHDNSDPLKINDGSHHVLVEHCRFHDGTDEELDILQAGVRDLVIRGNVFHQVAVRKPEAAVSVKWSAARVTVVGNVFANMSPDSSNGALRFGGSEATDKRPHDLLSLDNLFLHNGGRCDLNLGGATRVLVAGNVFFNPLGRGIIEASTNYPAGGNPNEEFFIVNNIFAHPGGELPTIYALWNGSVHRFTIRNNLYFNGGARVVASRRGAAFFDPTAEREALFTDPLFVGPLTFAGVPELAAWREAVAVREESPWNAARVPLSDLALPESLAALLRAHLHGEDDDDWYRRINPQVIPR